MSGGKATGTGAGTRSTRVPAQKARVRLAPFLVILFFVALFSIGVALEEPGRVLEQAVSICLSCIGIG